MFHSAAVYTLKKDVTMCSAGRGEECKTYISHLLSCAGGNKRASEQESVIRMFLGAVLHGQSSLVFFFIKKKYFLLAFMVSLAATAALSQETHGD